MASSIDEESWTHVTSKRNRRGKKGPNVNDSIKCHAAARTATHLSVEEIKSDHKKFSQQWTESDCYHKLKELIPSKSYQPFPTKAICLGLGSFDPEDGSWQIRRRSHIQLAAFVTLVDCILPPGNQKLRCIFQEPCFTRGDVEFLESLGYEVVESPRGFEEVSEDAIVVGIHLYSDIYTKAFKGAIPALFIGSGVDVWESRGFAFKDDPQWEKMRLLHDISDKIPFPDDKEFYPIFSDTTIHWRKPKDDELDDLTSAVDSLSMSQNTI
ncbi:hypothetical protein BKA67DRAFT_369779 [Truncatella angustata]|uniref:SRR1-like domain-containing protein n=1 Tax=Truncatella angustata TaxID=152316 RepID=A0A9P8UEY6_9PEZI|nr:uncharacterized protein BKA67DRAFT_369779 [Truncatella angustata]KAH6648664.1 hypothetical protein BKA67DRAFT_369779 [Truncatella angustata]KAH8198173.1 hypothetical protein TruAng_007654 [Truncatella angustata]